jgi:hypothetical protein
VPSWADFEAAAPEVAAKARELIERHQFVLAGTIRRDGTARISPVEAHLVRGQLMLVMIRGTLKARDVLRDPRLVLNSPVMDAASPVAELKLRGHAVPVEDPRLRAATKDAIESASGWRPRDDWHFFAIDLDDAAYMAWEGIYLRMDRWSVAGGLEHVEKLLDAPGA